MHEKEGTPAAGLLWGILFSIPIWAALIGLVWLIPRLLPHLIPQK